MAALATAAPGAQVTPATRAGRRQVIIETRGDRRVVGTPGKGYRFQVREAGVWRDGSYWPVGFSADGGRIERLMARFLAGEIL